MNALVTIAEGACEGIDRVMMGEGSAAPGQLGRQEADRGMLQAYAGEAGWYDWRTGAFEVWRRRLVALLPLRRGDVVLDVGCGTGLCLPLLEERVGPEGTLVGIDRSGEMLALARRRALDSGWRNVVFVESAVEDADMPVVADAALICAVHDILRSPCALRTVFRHVRPGGWIAAGGGKWAAPWMVGLNLFVYASHRPYVSSFAGFGRPWYLLEDFVDGLRVTDVASGGGYLAVGRARVWPPTRSAAPAVRLEARPPRPAR